MPPLPDAALLDSVAAITEHGSALAASKALGIPQQTLLSRLESARSRGLTDLPPAARHNGWPANGAQWTYPREQPLTVAGGVVLVGGDMHAWDGPHHPIWDAFCDLARWLRPVAIVLQGDMTDGARVSRHPKMRGQQTPTIGTEIQACRSRLAMLPDGQERFWCVSNHDIRVDHYLANMAPELDDFAGRFRDRFPDWTFAHSVVINGACEIRHDFRSGVHSRYNNTLHGGRTFITGHTHQKGVTPFIDRNGTRWGVETGVLCDPEGPQFEYGGGRPNRAEVGFAVLTFDKDGDLLTPELCDWRKGQAWFRGEPVKPRIRVKAASGYQHV